VTTAVRMAIRIQRPYLFFCLAISVLLAAALARRVVMLRWPCSRPILPG
jgi:hypothetical protein